MARELNNDPPEPRSDNPASAPEAAAPVNLSERIFSNTQQMYEDFRNYASGQKNGQDTLNSFFGKGKDSLIALGDLFKTAEEKAKDKGQAQNGAEGKGDGAGKGDGSVAAADGNTWRKGENGWQLHGKDGKVVDKYKDRGEIKDVSKDAEGNVTLKFKDNTAVQEKADGSRLDYNKDGKLTKLTYPDGSTREYKWDGDKLTGMKSPDGTWWDRQTKDDRGKEKYDDSWAMRKPGSENNGQKQVWQGKIDVDQQSGATTLKSLTGEQAKTAKTIRSDKAEETVKPDGSKDVRFPNKNTISYNPDGTMSQMTIDGVKREFGWGKDENGKPTLTSMKRTEEGKDTYNWQKTDKGWTVNGEARPNTDLSVDSKKGTYTVRDSEKKENTTYDTAGKVKTQTDDGASLEKDKFGNITKFEKDGKIRELKADEKSGQPTEVKDQVTGRTYKPSADGKSWTATDASGKPVTGPDGKPASYKGTPELNSKGEITFNTDNGKQTIKLDGSESQAIKNKSDNSLVERKGDKVTVTTADGTKREFDLKDGQPIRETTTRGGKTETWERGQDKGNGVYEWTKAGSNPPETRTGKAELDDKANFKFTHYGEDGKPNGKTYEAKTDSTEHHADSKSKSELVYKNGMEHQMKLPDGSIRTFQRGNLSDPKEITSLEVKLPGKEAYKWEKVPGKDQYKSGDTTVNAKIETKDGKYIYKDLDEKTITTRSTDGKQIVENQKTGITTESVNGEITRFKKGDNEVSLKRDDKKEVTEIQDTSRNLKLSRQPDGSWKSSAIDDEKPFKAPEKDPAGKPELNKNGSYTFTGDDRVRERFNIDGTHDRLGTMDDLRDRIQKSDALSADQKQRLLDDYLPKFESRKFNDKNEKETEREKTETIYQMTRLLDSPGENAYKASERAKMLEQTAFHAANPDSFVQKGNTCNVSDIGGALLHDDPSHFARVIADVGTTGQFRTADGSTINPPRKDIQEGLRDQAFPPDKHDPEASGVSRMFALTAANIHWQRRTTDNLGNKVDKGSIYYHQQGGEALYQYKDGTGRALTDTNGRKIDSPSMHAADIMDAFKQITGRPEEGRYIINAGITPEGNGAKADKSVTKVTTSEEFSKALAADKRTKIVQVHTGHPPFYKDSGYGKDDGAGGPNGGWHVVLATKYEPAYKDAAKKTLDPGKSKVYVDNTWGPKADRLTAERAISLSTMLKATTAYK
jgi:YD repeat-containing protein